MLSQSVPAVVVVVWCHENKLFCCIPVSVRWSRELHHDEIQGWDSFTRAGGSPPIVRP